MILFRDTLDFHTEGPCAVTLGKFDGVHLGHQKLLKVVSGLKEKGEKAVAFTLNPRTEDLILTEREQSVVMEQMGMDYLIRCPFVPAVSGMTPEEFAQRVLVEQLHAESVVVGADFRFGHDRAGDAAWLKVHEKDYGFTVYVIEKETRHGRDISSTYIREALREGDMELAAELMGRPFSVHEKVVRGHGLGKKIEIPTANILPPRGKCLPPDGVYVSQLCVNGECLRGMTNIGFKPTVDGSFRGIETNLLDEARELYDCEVEVRLLKFLRPEMRFDGVDALVRQIRRDEQAALAYFKGSSTI